MEQFNAHCESKAAAPGVNGTVVGVVGSGNLEVLVEKGETSAAVFNVLTAVGGYRPLWDAVMQDFARRQAIGGLTFSIHDAGASPPVVMLRLLQALEAYQRIIA